VERALLAEVNILRKGYYHRAQRAATQVPNISHYCGQGEQHKSKQNDANRIIVLWKDQALYPFWKASNGFHGICPRRRRFQK
jgi:hypothetical protein